MLEETDKKIQNEQEECPDCSKKFLNRSSLNRHRREFHSKKGENYRCLECNTEHKRKENLIRHIRSRHIQIRVECPFCIKTFGFQNQLVQHLQGDHNFKVCKTCNAWTFSFDGHNCDLEKRYYRCSVKNCKKSGFRFQKIQSFLQHVRRDHQLEDYESLARVTKKSVKRDDDFLGDSVVCSEEPPKGDEKTTPTTKASLNSVFLEESYDDEEYKERLDNLYILCSVKKQISLDDLRGRFELRPDSGKKKIGIKRTKSKSDILSKGIQKKRQNRILSKSERKNLRLLRRAKGCLEAHAPLFNLTRKKSIIPMIKSCKKYRYFQDTIRMNMIRATGDQNSLRSYKNNFINIEKKKSKRVSFMLEHEHEHRCTLCYPAKRFDNVIILD